MKADINKKNEFFDGNITYKRLFIYGLEFIIITSTLFINCSCRNSATKKDSLTYITYIDGNGFGFDIPEDCKNITDDDLGKSLIEINPTINFIAILNFPFGNTLFSVSTYDLNEETPVDSAFNKILTHIPLLGGDTAERYKLMDYGIKNLNEKFLRYKISCIDDSTYNIMYYFMKDDYSRILYEIKSVCQSKDHIKTVQDFLEKIALRVNFNYSQQSKK